MKKQTLMDIEKILRDVIEHECADPKSPTSLKKYLTEQGYIEEQEDETLHKITPDGALLYAEVFSKLTDKK